MHPCPEPNFVGQIFQSVSVLLGRFKSLSGFLLIGAGIYLVLFSQSDLRWFFSGPMFALGIYLAFISNPDQQCLEPGGTPLDIVIGLFSRIKKVAESIRNPVREPNSDKIRAISRNIDRTKSGNRPVTRLPTSTGPVDRKDGVGQTAVLNTNFSDVIIPNPISSRKINSGDRPSAYGFK
jgi:hypothetical protein